MTIPSCVCQSTPISVCAISPIWTSSQSSCRSHSGTLRLIEHSYSRLLSVHSVSNLLLVVFEPSDPSEGLMVWLQEGLRSFIRILSDLHATRRADAQVRTCCLNKYLLIIVSAGNDNEIIMANCKTKNAFAKGFLTGRLIEVQFRNNEEVSLLCEDAGITLLELKLSSQDAQFEQVLSIKEKIAERACIACHCWAECELITADFNNTLHIYSGGREVETLETAEAVCLLKPLISGFLACGETVLMLFRQSSMKYSLVARLQLPGLDSAANMQLSPQEDILVYYSGAQREIVVVDQFQERLTNPQKPPPFRLSHNVAGSLRVYSSQQQMFVTSQDNTISIYSAITFEPFLRVEITHEDTLGSMVEINSKPQVGSLTGIISTDEIPASSGEAILCLALHPSSPVLAVALTGRVRIYSIFYGELRLLRSISVSNCRSLGYNRSGSVLWLLIRGKQGAKAYLYLFPDFQLIETLSIGRKVTACFWGKLDSTFCLVHESGYYLWSSESGFKSKSEHDLQLRHSIEGGDMDAQCNLIVWGGRTVSLLAGTELLQEVDFPSQVSRVIRTRDRGFIVMLSTGAFLKVATLDQNSIRACQPLQLRCTGGPTSLCEPIGHHLLLLQGTTHDIYVLQYGKPELHQYQSVSIDRRTIKRLLQQHQKYQAQLSELSSAYRARFEDFKVESARRFALKEAELTAELRRLSSSYQEMKAENERFQEQSKANTELHELGTMRQVKELEKLYERKIAIITNKLLTSDEINFRNMSLAEQNLVGLEQKHDSSIDGIRSKYAQQLAGALAEKDQVKAEVVAVRKEYESKLADLEEENQSLLRAVQLKGQDTVTTCFKKIHTLEDKLSKEKSEKVNLEIQHTQLTHKNDELAHRLRSETDRKEQETRRNQQLQTEIAHLRDALTEASQKISTFDKKAHDLQKFNEILKHRVVEYKEQHDPQEIEAGKLRASLTELEAEYALVQKEKDDALDSALLYKREAEKLKKEAATLLNSKTQLQKKFLELVDRTREAAKLPIQDIRRQLVSLINKYTQAQTAGSKDKQDSPLGELNRIKDHLEVCLSEAVTSNKKMEEQRQQELTRKNIQNSELICEINGLRKRLKQLEESKPTEKEQELPKNHSQTDLSQLDHSSLQKDSSYERTAVRTQTKIRARDTSFERSLFRGNWHTKRLKTEHGTRYKHTLSSGKRDNSLLIEPTQDDAEDYRRIIEQKETIIKHLISRIQSMD